MSSAPERYPRLLVAVTLTEDRVVDRHGESVGRIERLVIDTVDGGIAFAIVSLDTHEPSDRLLAVPWRMVRPDPVGRRFVLRGERRSIEKIPPLDPTAWPELAERL